LPNPRPFAWGAAALGLGVLLGTTAVQAFSEASRGWLYTPLLVVEGVAALLLGIGFRSRVLALGGSAGVAVGALWSLFVFEVPLWADFGLIALVLLAAGAVLALLKDRLGAARAELAQTWRDWN
ncbi:MAG TPA: hypothetical protein VK131_09140, partial [Candidatus Acidoferrales bacterium]|nr:hypothetical protein [Candidatus Acidoferrales bacterium]